MKQRPNPTPLILQKVTQKVTKAYSGRVSIPVYAARLVMNQVVLQALLSHHNLLPVTTPIHLLKVTKHQHRNQPNFPGMETKEKWGLEAWMMTRMQTEAGREGKVARSVKPYPKQQQATSSDLLAHARNAILKFTLRRKNEVLS